TQAASLATDDTAVIFQDQLHDDRSITTLATAGGDVKRLTHTAGYAGGPVFSDDGKWIAYRANHPKTDAEIAKYKSLLSQDLVEPNAMDLFVMRADGSEQKQITNVGGASFAPSFYPKSERIIFSSNYEHAGSSEFELY